MNTVAKLNVKVVSKCIEAEGIASFELVALDGQPLPAFTAGSHIDVRMPDGIVRQYSLCNDPSERHRYLIAVLKEPASRGGSRWMHEQIPVGEQIEISVPRNHFPLTEGPARSLLIAGGIGVTPLLCMGERLASIGADFVMHYCTRSPDRTAFRERMADARFAGRVRFHHDDGAERQKFDVSRVLAEAGDGYHLYVCGPKGFMDAVLGEARRQGLPEDRLHCEYFGAGPVTADHNQAFDVQLASSGKVVRVLQNQTVVQALNAAGIEVETSCGEGVCGTCIVHVLQGIPDHRDLYFSPEEQAANDQFTPCCSRAKSPLLVLDL